MEVERLRTYERTDHSNTSDSRVSGSRTIGPAGCLIHTTSATSSIEWLTGGSARNGRPAGADSLIDRNGHQHILTQPGRYAYHAGVSSVTLDREYRGDEVSQMLLGIELECLNSEAPTWEQYDSLADLICYYALHFGWSWPYIYYGHYGVAVPMGRRSDPVHFDWAALMGRLYVRTKQARIPGL
jgi:N-acetyl-anhydromuramyl-L-alanine amidase AmpD